MGFSLFKNDDQLFAEALDLVKRKEYDKAMNSLRKARDKDKDGNITVKCTAMESVLFLHNRQNDPNAYNNAANNLNALGEEELELGLTTFNVAKLSTECAMMAKVSRQGPWTVRILPMPKRKVTRWSNAPRRSRST